MIKASSRQSGTLYIVATPIGNREDISLRAINVLKSVDHILAADTRHSKHLLVPLGITTPLMSLHAHNETSQKIDELIAALHQGQSYALISDAGTPLISDPGFPLVKTAHEQGLSVVPIPGPCALITALSAAGIPCDTFTFVGFLPAKTQARRDKLQTLKSTTHTIIFYESTHRLIDCLQDLAIVFGSDSPLVLAKELTKAFETFIHGNSETIQAWLLADPARCKGEFVIILSPRPSPVELDEHHLLTTLLTELPLKQAVKLACQLTGGNKNVMYKLALSLQENPK